MRLLEIADYQHRLVNHLDDGGLTVSFGNDLTELLDVYGAVTGTGYVQLPYVVAPEDATPYNFWVAFHDGEEPVALTAFRTLRNGGERQRVGSAFNHGALYRQTRGQREEWWNHSGPMLAPGALYGYIGAGWVHPRLRGRNLAGFIARIAQAEALKRTDGTLAVSTALTKDDMYRSGMNLRASGLHHQHVEQVLEGYCQVVEGEAELYLSYSTAEELSDLYAHEVQMLRGGRAIPWLHSNDKSFAAAVLVEAKAERAAATQAAAEEPVSGWASLAA